MTKKEIKRLIPVFEKWFNSDCDETGYNADSVWANNDIDAEDDGAQFPAFVAGYAARKAEEGV
jgi:hypothetical protein